MTEFHLEGLPGIPKDEGGPVFRAPWEAQAFAMVVSLHEKGLFPWSEWAERLAGAIAKAQREGDPDLGDTYYEHWLNALEGLLQDHGLATPDVLSERQSEIRHAHEHADDDHHH